MAAKRSSAPAMPASAAPIACLAAGGSPIIGAWTTASERVFSDDEDDQGETWRQLSRLGHPLVNELVIGINDKDKFNGSEPKHDGQFAKYVTNPTLPVLINALFGVAPPPAPRNDLVTVFLTGVTGLNQPKNVTPSEMLRLNTSIAPTAEASQNHLGVIGGDNAGFPNGRRPGDDVVDVALRVVEGALCGTSPTGCAFSTAPLATFPALTDGAFINATVAYTPEGALTSDPSLRLFRPTFPYLRLPLSGSPGSTHQ